MHKQQACETTGIFPYFIGLLFRQAEGEWTEGQDDAKLKNPMRSLHTEILRVLLYYDIWSYPLTARELFRFLSYSTTFEAFLENIRAYGPGPNVLAERGYYFVRGAGSDIIDQREQKERHAERLWIAARISMHIIKRFPFVRGIFVSGDLSKSATTPNSDVDFFIVTKPNRLWVARILLIMFKKTFLLNKKKYFCLNYFASSDHLMLDEQNIFLATEIAHLKPLYNANLFATYFEANDWIRTFFPNFAIDHTELAMTNNRASFIQKLIELPFLLFPTEKLDTYLLNTMKRVWAKRYPEFDDETRERIFRCTKGESRAYAGNFEQKILALYDQKLKQFGIND